MSLVFEDPPAYDGQGAHLAGVQRDRTPVRKEIDSMLSELSNYPARWARLFDFNDREEADKRATQVRTAAGKGWNVATRRRNDGSEGWSVFARMRSPEEVAASDARRAEAKARREAATAVMPQGQAQAEPPSTFQ